MELNPEGLRISAGRLPRLGEGREAAPPRESAGQPRSPVPPRLHGGLRRGSPTRAPRPHRRPATARPGPPRPGPAPGPPRPAYLAVRPRPARRAGGQGPRDVARSRARPHHVQQRRQRPRGRRGAAGREAVGGAAGPRLPPHVLGPAEGGADGHAADRLHLREELCVDQLQRLQLLRSGHHLQLDNDPRLLPGAPVPPLPLAHVHQLAPVGTSALLNRYPAPPDRLHRGSLQELRPEWTGGWIDLRFRGHLPLPGEHLDVLQDFVCDPVNGCSCVTPPQTRPRGRPRGQEGRWPAPMKGS